MAINRAKMKALPIRGYLDWQGIEYKDEGRFLRLIDHDSLIIDQKKNTFIWNKTRKGGDLGDFITAYDNISPKEAWLKWTAFSRYAQSGNVSASASYTPREKRDFDFNRWKTATKTTNTINYLTKQRGLNKSFIQAFLNSQLIEQGTPRKNRETGDWQRPPVLFKWLDENGKVVGLDEQGTETDFKKFQKRGTEKRVAANSDSDYGFNFRFGNGHDHLIVFEAPIDALSYAQENFKTLRKTNTTFLSLSSTNQNKIYKELDRLHKQSGHFPSIVSIATDNDVAGYEVAHRLNQFEFKDITMQRLVPVEGKDWNDQLKSGKKGQQVMTLDQSDERLEAIKAQQQAAPVESDEKAFKQPLKPTDDHQVIHQQTQVAKDQPETRADRRALNRANNQAIIDQSLKEFQKIRRNPQSLERYLEFLATNQPFSPQNSMLIAGQRANPELVMGYKQFKQHNILVNRGEKGMRIYGAPAKVKSVIDPKEGPIFWPDTTPEQRRAASEGKLKMAEIEHYPIKTVFDIRQTNATKDAIEKLKPTPVIDLSKPNSDKQLNNVYQELKNFSKELGFQVYDQNTQDYFTKRQVRLGKPELAKSVAIRDSKNPQFNSIMIRDNLALPNKVASLAYEVGHVQLHQNESKAPTHKDASLRAVQADMTSFVVLRNLGLKPEKIKQDYLPNWEQTLEKAAQVKDPENTFVASVSQASKPITEHLADRLANGQPVQAKTQSMNTSEAKHIKQKQNTNAEQTIIDQSMQSAAMRR